MHCDHRQVPLRSIASDLHQVLLDPEVVDDELLALGCVLAHEEREQFVAAVQMRERYGLEPDAGADKVLELVGRNLAQSLEARDLRAVAKSRHRRLLLRFRIAVDGLLLVAHAKERGVEDEQMTARDELREEWQEERNQQEPDMHAVHVGVGGNYDAGVAQAVEPLLDVQRRLQEVELLVLVNHLLGQAVGIERLALEGEDRLGLHIAAGGQRAGGGIAFDDEERALLGPLVPVAEVEPAIAQLAVVERRFLGPLAGEAADPGEFLALPLVVLELALERVGGLAILVEPAVERLLAEGADELPDGRAAGRQVGGPELGLGLRLKHRFDDAHGNRGDNRLAHIGGVEVFLVEVAQHLDDGLAERLLVGAPHRGMLAVDEGVIFLAVVRAVGKGDFDVLALEVDDGIEDVAAEVLLQQVPEPMLGLERLAVEGQRQTAVEKRVLPEQVLDEFRVEPEVLPKQLFVRRERDEGAVALVRLRDLAVLLQLAARKLDHLRLAVADGLGAVGGGERIDRFLADAVQTDGLLEGLGVILGAGVDDRHAFEDFAQRDPAAVVAHPHGALVELDLDLLAAAHGELVDAVVDRLLQEHVDAVLAVAAVAEAADVHAGAQPDVLRR